jgi:type I protein arginine methyltransferase
MYSVLDFGKMIADEGRMDAYADALRSVVNPGSVVLDIGSGTGIFALLACKYGARKVYAIEPNESIQLAREVARNNDWVDRITIIQDLSTRVNLPEPVTVIISDLRGALPLYQHHLPSIIDARDRLLSPAGIMIPHRDRILAAPVASPDLYKQSADIWRDKKFGFEMHAARNAVVNSLWGDEAGKEELVAEPETWITIDYTKIDKQDFSAGLNWNIEERVTAHGIRVWFDTDIYKNIGFSNRPGTTSHVYGSLFFPWPEPVDLSSGNLIAVKLRANLVGDEYIWQWNSTVHESNNTGLPKVAFNQSSFQGTPLSPDALRKRGAHYMPTLNDDGLIDYQILDMIKRGILLEDIARQLCQSFPERYSDWQQALAHVGDLSLKYSE